MQPSTSATIVLDSSAIASIFFKDKKFGDKVINDLGQYERFATVDVAFAEVASVAWKSVVLFKERKDVAAPALSQAVSFIRDNCEVISTSDLIAQAYEVGTNHGIQIYDSLFLALALRFKCKMLTTDEKLHNKTNSIKELRASTILP